MLIKQSCTILRGIKCTINRNISKNSISYKTWEHEGLSDWSWTGIVEQHRRFKEREVADLKPDRYRVKELSWSLDWAGRRKRVSSKGAKMAENGVDESKADIWITVTQFFWVRSVLSSSWVRSLFQIGIFFVLFLGIIKYQPNTME